MPEHYFREHGVDKEGLLSMLEHASTAVDAVHTVIEGLPEDFGPVNSLGEVSQPVPDDGRVRVRIDHHGLYRAMFDPEQVCVEVQATKTRAQSMVRIRAVEGDFWVPRGHLVQAG
jgi:hypothetical protein